MDENISQPVRRTPPYKASSRPKPVVRGAMGVELRSAIARAKAEATHELEGVDYAEAPREPKDLRPKIWKHSPVPPECCHVRRAPQRGKRGHKPKQGKGRKLTDIAAGMPKPSAALPMVFHLLRRFVDKQHPGNEFEVYVFDHLAKLEGKHLESLVAGLEHFEAVKEPYRSSLFDDRFDRWAPMQPVGPSLLHWTLLDDSITLKTGRGLDKLLFPALVRPWTRVVGVGDFQSITAPWPWINAVEGLRTVDHMRPIDFFYPSEYEHSLSWTTDPNTGQPIIADEMTHYPSCSVEPQHDKQGNCLRVAELRVGGTVTLTGFNYFSKSPTVSLTRFDGNVIGETFVVDGFAIADPDAKLKDDKGNVISDDTVNDRLVFDIPTLTPDGQHQFPPGVYALAVTMPNDVHYTALDGTQANEFTSNTAYLRVLPSGGERYRVWSDEAHCYDPTDGEWGSDELALEAIIATIDPATNTPILTSRGALRWGGVDGGDSTSYLWNLLGSPGQPEAVNGFLAVGLLGWEVDSEDALSDNIRNFGAAFTEYWGIIWKGIVAAGGIAGAVGALTSLLSTAPWWVAIVIVAIVLIVATIVGLIWAAWAPPDRIIVDVVALSEMQLYYLTLPIAAPPPPQQFAANAEVQVAVTPEQKVAYLYSEERRYDCSDEGSSYGFQFKYERDV